MGLTAHYLLFVFDYSLTFHHGQLPYIQEVEMGEGPLLYAWGGRMR